MRPSIKNSNNLELTVWCFNITMLVAIRRGVKLLVSSKKQRPYGAPFLSLEVHTTRASISNIQVFPNWFL